MRDANRSTPLSQDDKHQGNDPAENAQAPQTGKNEDDARGREADKLPENRRKLGVDEEHKTEEMQRGHRGTFP